MKNIFIINPHAGKPSGTKKLVQQIHSFFETHPEPYQLCFTSAPGEGRDIARRFAQTGEEMRIFACGGDGSCFDVLNGIAGYHNAALGVIPCGTGNDFLKTFTHKENFSSLAHQLSGSVCRLDAIRAGEHLCLNQASMGMDANVCANKDKFKKIPFVGGQLAYILSLLYCFFTKLKTRFTVQIDGQPPVEQDYFFAIAANGRFYGGGFQSAPLAHPADGQMDCVTITPVSRLRILSLLKKYTAGKHLGLPICHYQKGKTMTVTASQDVPVNLDGEVVYKRSVTFSLQPDCVNFILPQGCALPQAQAQRELAQV